MKYTRYDIKKKRNNNFALGFVLIGAIIFAFLLGTFITNMLVIKPGDNVDTVKPQDTPVNQGSSTASKKSVKYIAIQGGMFEKVENAERSKSSLSVYGNPFTIQEQNATRVFLGIYNEEEGIKLINSLKEKSVESSKMVFEINTAGNPCNEELSAIISAEIDILSKLNDKNTKSFQTDELKKWVSDFKEVDKNSKNIDLLSELKAHINNLPKELDKNKASEYYTFLYGLMKKIS
jgi:hypothetical protein